MNTEQHVEINRTFSPVPETEKDYDIMSLIEERQEIDWTHVEENHCAVILAGAGFGKTHEMKHRAEMKQKAGATAFFIRIEDIDKNFMNSFEVGDETTFKTWVSSVDKAWFYLDSIDEARLNNPRTFEKAIRYFAQKIKSVQYRANIVISSRPYAWRNYTDRIMVERYLPKVKQITEVMETENTDEFTEYEIEHAKEITKLKHGLRVFSLNDLTETEIRIFAKARGVIDEDILFENIQRRNLHALAARPYDLESIIEKWKKNGKFGSRLELLNFGINQRLSEINPDRNNQQSLSQQQARSGARFLAVSVILTGKSGIRIPDSQPLQDGIDANTVLSNWNHNDIQKLLERGIFDDVHYGKVRFRHREILELLAAEWFYELLQDGSSRREIEYLIFREKYGHRFISPRLRPLIPWLMLWDVNIYQKAIFIDPEIAMEGGDPSQLSFERRQKLLNKIATKFSLDYNTYSVIDVDTSIGIAVSDLSDDVSRLIDKYRKNDSVLFLLGKMIWQGEMISCIKQMIEIALDIDRDNVIRITAIKTVASIGTREEFDIVWDKLINSVNLVDREIAAVVINNAPPDYASIKRFISLTKQLKPYSRSRLTGFSIATHKFLDRCDIKETNVQREMAEMIQSLTDISLQDKNTWLLEIMAHVICNLINVHSQHVISKNTVNILYKISSNSHRYNGKIIEYKERLEIEVPKFSDLNDFIFWSAVSKRYTHLNTDSYYHWDLIQIFDRNFCSYTKLDLNRILSFISNRKYNNDKTKMIVITLTYFLIKNDKIFDKTIIKIRDSIKNNENLVNHFEGLINWEFLKKQKTVDKNLDEKRQESQDLKAIIQREQWINNLKSSPDIVSHNLFCLMEEIEDNSRSRSIGKEWESLIDTFGLKVAETYRDAVIEYWPCYTPLLASEGNSTKSIPNGLLLGLSGLEIESRKISNFPKNLDDDKLRHALRYTTWELGQFPTWLEKAYNDRPQVVSNALLRELEWEITQKEISGSYILNNLVSYAPWIHKYIAEWIITWLEKNSIHDLSTLSKLIFIAKNTDDTSRLLDLAYKKSKTQAPIDVLAKWFALQVDINADQSIGRMEKWLVSLPSVETPIAAQYFITELIGNDISTSFNSYQTPTHLKHLFEITLKYTCKEEDIDRTDCDAYTPDVRDNAQEARDILFNDLCNISGKKSFLAIKELAENNSDKKYSSWMFYKARKRAKDDGDIDSWSEQQLQKFNTNQMMMPKTNDQLFSVTVNQLIDIKDWLENGDYSEYKTWQKADSESEVRNLFASRLNDLSKGRYNCSQENEFPNAQKPDIWIQKPDITPIPIEIKLLDKQWSGPKICERLRIQLAKGYLRDRNGGRGIMLLVSLKCKPSRKWRINEHYVNLENLEDALQIYWESIALDYPNVEKIKIIVINLMQREKRSNT